MSGDRDTLEYDNAKSRMRSRIAFVWRCYGEDGRHLPSDSLRDDFAVACAEQPNLSSLWNFIGEPLKRRIREMVEDPALHVNLANGKSWQDYDRQLLAELDGGEQVEFADNT